MPQLQSRNIRLVFDEKKNPQKEKIVLRRNENQVNTTIAFIHFSRFGLNNLITISVESEQLS